MGTKKTITVETRVKAPVDKVWQYWTGPRHIEQWNNASDDWHTPHAENDPRTGGRFLSRMEARDGSEGFDFAGIYDEVKQNGLLAYTIADGRKVTVTFVPDGNETRVTETFETENTHDAAMQRAGWQAILDSFKTYAEKNT